MLKFLKIPVIALCLLAWCSSSVYAQESENGSKSEIIVTAKRSEQALNDYAGAISKLSPEQLDAVNAVHPSEALNTVSGVNIHRGSGQEHLTAIRSPVLTGGAGAGSFLYLEDGIPLRAAGFANVNGLFESAIELAETVEINKGPGSVLYGSNAVHGLINVQSRAPSADFGGDANILLSSEGFVRGKASLTGAVGPGALRAGLVAAHDNGFRSDSGFDQQKLQIRYDGQFGGWDVKALTSLQNLNQETAGFIRGDDAYLDETISETNPNPEAYRDGQSARTSIRFDKKTGETGTITLIPYARWVELDFLRHFVPGQAREENGHKSVGFLGSYAMQHDKGSVVFGLDAELTDGYLRESQDGPNVFSFVQGPHYDYDVKSTVFSAYAQSDWILTPSLTLDLGLRADWTEYQYDTQLTPGNYGRFQVVPDRTDSFSVLTPKAALNYKFGGSGHAYARYARGARAPQTSDAYSLQTRQLVGEIQTETVDSFEAGLSANASGVKLSADIYYMNKRNFFFRDSDGFNVSDGKTDHYGLELGALGKLTEKISINGNISLARHRYNFDLRNPNPANAIVDGNDVDSAPRTLATLGFSYDVSPRFNAGLEWRHMGKYFTDPGNTQSYPGHDVFVFRGRWELNDQLSFYGRIDNLFDEKYADRADFAFGSERYFPGRGRTAFIGVNSTF